MAITDEDMQRIIDNSNKADERQYQEWVKAGKPTACDACRASIAQEIREELSNPCPHQVIPDEVADPFANIILKRECTKCWQDFWQKYEVK